MKNNSSKSLNKQGNKQILKKEITQSDQPQHHDLLQYYKNKINALCQERLAWLAKFDQCKSKLNQKHTLKQKLLNFRNQQRQLNRSLVHHDIALLDQRLNVIRMQRDNLVNDYRDAQEVIKIGELMEEYPIQIQKMLPCSNLRNKNDQIIKNELNIHTSKGKNPITSRSSKKMPPNNFNIKNSLSQKRNSVSFGVDIKSNMQNKSTQKITAQELFQRQIVELKRNQNEQTETMRQLTDKLQNLIKKTKEQEKAKLNKEREIVQQLNRQYKTLQKKHKELAEEYFSGRREQKASQQNLLRQKEELISKNKNLQQKVNKEIKTYQKQNKAKQTLIIKKSQDFQQTYKAKMRAKERNLQALKQNYEKMQNICIEKVKKLQKALGNSKNKLKQAQNRKEFLVEELRQQLHEVQKRVQQQKNEREQRQLKVKIKQQKQKARNEELRVRDEKEKAKLEKNRLIEQSYKRTVKANKSLSKSKEGQNRQRQSRSKNKQISRQAAPKKDIYGKQGEESEEDDSLQMDDLDNIRRQIGELETKIAADTR